MNTLSQVLEANKCFVFQSKIDSYTSISKVSKVPSRSIAILTCMDTRLVDFLEPALGIKRGEAKVIKNAGNSVTGPFSATIRNLLISIFELGVNEVDLSINLCKLKPDVPGHSLAEKNHQLI